MRKPALLAFAAVFLAFATVPVLALTTQQRVASVVAQLDARYAGREEPYLDFLVETRIKASKLAYRSSGAKRELLDALVAKFAAREKELRSQLGKPSLSDLFSRPSAVVTTPAASTYFVPDYAPAATQQPRVNEWNVGYRSSGDAYQATFLQVVSPKSGARYAAGDKIPLVYRVSGASRVDVGYMTGSYGSGVVTWFSSSEVTLQSGSGTVYDSVELPKGISGTSVRIKLSAVGWGGGTSEAVAGPFSLSAPRMEGCSSDDRMAAGAFWGSCNSNYGFGACSGSDKSLSGSCSGGKLYTWREAQSACPTGYRLPSRQDWLDAAGSAEPADLDALRRAWSLPLSGRRTWEQGRTFSADSGKAAYFWTREDGGRGNALRLKFMIGGGDDLPAESQGNRFSVRCVRE